MIRLRHLPSVLLAGLATWGCALPVWPVDAPLTSPYGVRFRGLLPGIHRGVDLAAPAGTPVRAMADGRVRFAGRMSGYGRVVWVEHTPDLLTVYAHLERIAVRSGQRVRRGQILGESGASGDTSGPHLHFEIWRWGRPVDPVPLLGGPPG